MGVTRQPRALHRDLRCQVVQEHLETYLALAHEADPMGDGVPGFVEDEFRSYLKCGILAHGFARTGCASCGYDFLVAFSCKGRGACPSCNAKRMAQTAAHLVEHVFPYLPVRQVVLSVPKRLRPFLHYPPHTAGAVLHFLLRALQATLREVCPTAPASASFGAVSFLHRFGSSLNPHYQHTIRRRVLRHCAHYGILEPHEAEDMLTWDHGGGSSSLDASVRIEVTERAHQDNALAAQNLSGRLRLPSPPEIRRDRKAPRILTPHLPRPHPPTGPRFGPGSMRPLP